MNGITHFLVGIVIVVVVWHYFSDEWAENKEWAKREVFSIKKRPVTVASILRVSVTSVAAFFSHTLVDGFAIFTYHPWKDQDILFNRIWTPVTLIFAAVVAFYALKKDFRYAWGIVFAAAFDLWDYSVLRVIMSVNPALDLSPFYLHHFEWAFIDAFLSWAPNYYQEPLASIVEMVIIGVLFLLWIVLVKKWLMPENKEIQPAFWQLLIMFAAFVIWFALDYII